MRDEIKDKMNDLAFKMQSLVDELRLDPGADAQFCARTISQSYAIINMRLGEQYGVKLMPKAIEQI